MDELNDCENLFSPSINKSYKLNRNEKVEDILTKTLETKKKKIEMLN